MTDFSQLSGVFLFQIITGQPTLDDVIKVKRGRWTSFLTESHLDCHKIHETSLIDINLGFRHQKVLHQRLLSLHGQKKELCIDTFMKDLSVSLKVIAGCNDVLTLVMGGLHLDHELSLSNKHFIH